MRRLAHPSRTLSVPVALPRPIAANAHEARGADGLIHVRYYLAPVGVAERDGWHPRDPALGLTLAPPAATGAVAGTAPAGATGSPTAMSDGSATPAGSATALATAAAPAQPAAASGRARPLALATAQATDVPSATAAPSDTVALGTATPTLPPAAPPFRIQAAPDSGPGSKTTITSEDGATLGIGLLSVNGFAPGAVPGQLGGGQVSYPAAIAAGSTPAPRGTPTGAAATPGSTVPLSGATPMPAAVAAGPADLALRQTASGLDARVTLHSAAQGGTAVFALAPDAEASVVQDARGIAVQRPVQQCGDAGPDSCFTSQAVEYRIGAPIAVDSSADADASVSTATVSETLTAATGSGAASITLTIDPTWLHDAARVWPVTLDLPIATEYADDETGVFGTISSCAPAAAAIQSDVMVGTVGSCTYRGIAYFDVSKLLLRLPVQSALLTLNTPDQTGDSGVQVYANAPGPLYAPLPSATSVSGLPAKSIAPASGTSVVLTPIPFPAIQLGQLPSWTTAPALPASSVGQSASNGHEQNWDVTGAVRQWLANRLTNNGLTLVGNGAPVRFASPLGAGAGSSGTAGYLDITYAPPTAELAVASGRTSLAPRAALTPCAANTCSYDDSGTGVFGVDGGQRKGGFCHNAYGVNDDPTNIGACESAIEMPTFVNNLNAQYVRVQAEINCKGAQSHANTFDPYWQGIYAKPDTGILANMNRAFVYGLIPLVTLNPNDNCMSQEWSIWSTFAYQLTQYPFQTGSFKYSSWAGNPPMYFELGNELNVASEHPSYQPQYQNRFWSDFGTGANNIYFYLSYYQPQWTRYHILTGGVVGPTASATGCSGQQYTLSTVNSALLDALSHGVPRQFLGAAVHPYGYSTVSDDPASWLNYGNMTRYDASNYNPNAYYTDTDCSRLSDMISLWRSTLDTLPTNGGSQAPIPLVITEINFSSLASVPQGLPPSSDPSKDGLTVASIETQSYDAARDGAYMTDLFTWFYNHLTVDGHLASLLKFPMRVLWFSGGDEKKSRNPQRQYYPSQPALMYKPYIGLYGGATPGSNMPAKKQVSVYCPTSGAIGFGTFYLNDLYKYLTTSICY